MSEHATSSNILCAVEDCGRSRYGRLPYCEKHHVANKKYGDPLGGKYKHAGRKGDFWSKVNKTDGCWLWLGTANRVNGNYRYGQTKIDGVRWLAHRYVYTQLVGPIPDGLELDHLCLNTLCVNPAHLEPVTKLENLRRRVWDKEQVSA